MEIQILRQEENSVTLMAGNKEYFFYKGTCSVNVCCKNASNRAYNRGLGGGKYFDNFDQAEAGYKSAAAKAAIRTAAELLK